MRDAGYTRQERSFIALMRTLAIVFLTAAAVFIALPDMFLNYLNNIGRVFAGWDSPPIDAGGRFWQVLTCSFMLTLTYICILAQMRPLRHFGYGRIVIFSKAVSTCGFAAMLFFADRQFYYLVGTIIDGSIFFITWYFYWSAAKSRG